MWQPTIRKQDSDDDDRRSVQSDKDEKQESLEEKEAKKAPKNEHDSASAQATSQSDLQPRQEDMELAAKIVIAADEGASEEQYKFEPSGDEREERAAGPSGERQDEPGASMLVTFPEEEVQQDTELDTTEPDSAAGDEGRRPDEPPAAFSDRVSEPGTFASGSHQTQQHRGREAPWATVSGAARVLGINGSEDNETVTTREESVAALSAQVVDTDGRNEMLRDYERLRQMEAHAALAQIIEEREPDNVPNDEPFLPGRPLCDAQRRKLFAIVYSILLLVGALVLVLVFVIPEATTVPSMPFVVSTILVVVVLVVALFAYYRYRSNRMEVDNANAGACFNTCRRNRMEADNASTGAWYE